MTRRGRLLEHVIEHGLAALALLALAFALYARILGAPFVFDDLPNLVHNPHVRWTRLDLESLRDAALGSPSKRPVANLSFALNHYLGRGDPTGYHVVNVAVHAANGGLVALLAHALFRRLRGRGRAAGPPPAHGAAIDRGLALFAGLLFVAHPLQTGAVSYVVQRMTGLATLFYLAALLLYASGRERRDRPGRRLRFGGAALCGVLALGSKQIAVTLPAALWLYEWSCHHGFDRDWARRSLARGLPPLAVLAAGVYLFAFWGPEWGYARRDFDMGERLLTQLRVVVFYASLVLFPHPGRLNLVHDFPVSHSLLDPPSTAASLLVLALAAAVAAASARRLPLLCFAVAWFALHLALESSFLPLEMAYEHRVYLPLAGIAPALALALRPLARRHAVAALAVAAAVLALCAAGTRVRNEMWRDPVALWSDAAAKSPGSARAHADLGASLAAAGRLEASLEPTRRALELDPDDALLHQNLGLTLTLQGRDELALHHFQQALRLRPDDANAHGSLGALLRRQGRLADAREHLERSAALAPRDPRARHNLGLLRLGSGDAQGARDELEAALRLDPDSSAVHKGLGRALEALGHLDQAEQHYRRAVALDPGDPSAHTRLGDALAARGLHREAVGRFEEALRLRPDAPLARQRLAWLRATSADPQVRAPEESLRLLPPDAPDAAGLDTRAAAHAALGHFERAGRLAARAGALARAEGDVVRARQIAAREALYRRGEALVVEPTASASPP